MLAKFNLNAIGSSLTITKVEDNSFLPKGKFSVMLSPQFNIDFLHCVHSSSITPVIRVTRMINTVHLYMQ